MPGADSPDRLIVNLRDSRTAAGLTQAELACLVGVSRKNLNTVESGVLVPSTVFALQLGRALNLTVEALFGLPDDTLRERDV
jgi:putative transcriptional regulator